MSVYTLIDSAQLSSFLQDYDLGELVAFEGISAGIENTNYFVDTTEGRFVLTIFEHHTADELGYFLNIMAFMAEHDIPTAHPKADKQGQYLKSLNGKPAALVERLNGKTLEQPGLVQCQVMAQNLARFHKAGFEFGYYRANDRGLDWAHSVVEQIQDRMSPEDQVLVGSELAFQETIDWGHLPQSVIHADLFTDNAMFEGDKLTGIIDLYYACHGACLYDLAVMVNDWCRDQDNRLNSEKLEASWQAYQTERPLSDAEHQAWSAALRMAALRFWLSRLKDKIQPREGEITMIKDPDVFKSLLVWHRKNQQQKR
jgi:homoserine kinase type II